MALELSQHCTFSGPALPEPFVQFELEKELNKANLLPRSAGKEGQALQEFWEIYRRKLRELVSQGGAVRVRNHVIEPLVERLGYAHLEAAGDVATREGQESGGYVMTTADGAAKLRVWCTDFNLDLDAPAKRGAAYRYSYLRIAQRVLLASGERLGLLTNGVELRLLISDPARPDSQVAIAIDPNWKRSRTVPDSYRLVLALAAPAGVKALPDLVDKARLQQARVTKELRVQARQAVQWFVQEVLDHPANREKLGTLRLDRQDLAAQLWREGLIIVYRLLFILKLESSDDVARSFSFASTSLWRNSFSPGMALPRYVRSLLDQGAETGSLLENGLRSLFRMFTEGLECTELHVKPLGGALFGADATPVLSELHWGERSVAHLLDQLLWTAPKRGASNRQRVHYGSLDVEDLGRVYEALLELEPGISTERMCRLRRQKLEVVVPVAQGEKYRPAVPQVIDPGELEEDLEEEEEDEAPKQGKKTKVEWIEEIPPDRFYLRVGLGRKASGSYYTPHSFVRFLVQETLGPQVEERSPKDDPDPLAILRLKVLDPAMGSGHFLVEACRFLGDKLYEACRLCDELAAKAEGRVERLKTLEEKDAALAEAQKFWKRVIDLPDPDDKLMKYLPSSAPEGKESGFSQQEAIALCRRLVAVHCLYGVDKNPLAVELAKLSLWIESHAEGLPLTFLDHRLVVGDSLTGPFFEHLFKEPASGDDVQKLVWQNVNDQFRDALAKALRYVRDLEASIGTDISDIEAKEIAKQNLDRALAPFKILAAAWSGGVMLGDKSGDTDYASLFSTIAQTGDLPKDLSDKPKLLAMIAKGLGVDEVPGDRSGLLEILASGRCVPALPYDLTFAETFYPDGDLTTRYGFDDILGNPPWDTVRPLTTEFLASFDLNVMDAPTKRERDAFEERLLNHPEILNLYKDYIDDFQCIRSVSDRIYTAQSIEVDGKKTGGDPDLAKFFAERAVRLTKKLGWIGLILPAAFHAASGTTGIRELYLNECHLKRIYSFHNSFQLFPIETKVKFDIIIAHHHPNGTQEIQCRFKLNQLISLFESEKDLKIARALLREISGDYQTFLDFDTQTTVDAALSCLENSCHLISSPLFKGIAFGSECHSRNDSPRFSSTNDVIGKLDPRDSDVLVDILCKGYFVISNEDSIHMYEDHWTDPPRYLIHLNHSLDRQDWFNASRYYRLMYRRIANIVDLRSMKAALVPPGWISTSPIANRTPCNTPISRQLAALGFLNTFPLDWNLRLRLTATLNLFIVRALPVPEIAKSLSFLAHSALRLTCNHSGYKLLWHEQLDNQWREPDTLPFTFPVLATEDDRWSVRAAIDAVVAQAYGLNRDQYAHILSTFSHKSYLKAPQLCLDRFDELEAIGLEAFTKKYDPYWDIPLNETLPQPVIDLPIPETLTPATQQGSLDLDTASDQPKRQRRKKS